MLKLSYQVFDQSVIGNPSNKCHIRTAALIWWGHFFSGGAYSSKYGNEWTIIIKEMIKEICHLKVLGLSCCITFL